MGYKMKKGELKMDNTPIYQVKLDGAYGQANKNGSIIVNDSLLPEVQEDVVRHEKVHLDQMKRGDLDYDEKYVYWKGKRYPRSIMDEGKKSLPWEKEAWRANKLKYT